MRRRSPPLKAQPSAAERFAQRLFAEVPAPVMARLQPLHALLADNLQGLDDVSRHNLREALAQASARLTTELALWNQSFVLAMAHAGEPGFGERLKRLPAPPPEPEGLWDELIAQAAQPDETGVAACLVLYDLGCARAFRAFKPAS